MLASMAYELLSRGRVHKVDAMATAIMLIAFPRVLLERSESWMAVGRVLLQPFL
jgi:hypothetical protein